MPTPTLELRDGRYYAIWSDNRRSKRKSMGTPDRAVAEQRFAQWLLFGGHKGQVADEAKGGLTVAELWEVYETKHVDKHVAAPATIGFCWKNLRPHFGHLTLDKIHEDTVEEYGDKREDGDIGRPSKPSTVRKELAALVAMLNWHAAPERGKKALLTKKDIPSIRLPAEADPRDRWLTSEEIKAVMSASRRMHPGDTRMSRGERFLWLALETAARKQAILDLTWDRVDFETRMINYAVPGRKQTKKRRPSVPISDALLPVLKRMHDERVSVHVLDHDGEVWATMQAIVIKAGLSPKLPRATGERIKSTGISPHTFRHTAATHMARRGVPLYTIAGVLGNTLAMVERVYAKQTPSAMLSAVNAISGSYKDDYAISEDRKRTAVPNI